MLDATAITPRDYRQVQSFNSGNSQLALNAPETEPGEKDGEFKPFGDEGLGFFDLLDILNPLHHLPFVGPMYREITGDELAAAPRLMGSALYLGPIGLVGSAVDVVLEEVTGKDLGGNIMSVLGDDGEDGDTLAENNGPQSVSVNNPAAAGTDAADPVTAWAMSELNHRQAQAENQGLEVPATPYSHLLSSRQPAAPLEDARQVRPFIPSQQIVSGPDPIPSAQTRRRANNAYLDAAGTPQRQATPQPLGTTPPVTQQAGVIAKEGGWFSTVMLDALDRTPPEALHRDQAAGRKIHDGIR